MKHIAIVLGICITQAGCPSGSPPATSAAGTSAAPGAAAAPTTPPSGAAPAVVAPTATPPVAAVPVAAAPAPTPPSGAPAAAGPTAASGTALPPLTVVPHGPLCEVEFGGKVQYAGKVDPKLHWFVFAAQGDCMTKNPHILGTAAVSPDGTFFSEVFVKWGSDVTFCAAALEAQDKPTTLYGKAEGKFHAEATGEVVFKGLVIVPKPGPSKIFPPLKDPLK